MKIIKSILILLILLPSVAWADEVDSVPSPAGAPICSTFRSPLQTWYDDATSGGYFNVQTSGAKVIGTLTLEGDPTQRLVGFKPSNIVVANPNSMKPCDDRDCIGAPELRVLKQALGAFPPTSDTLRLNNYGGYQRLEVLSASGHYKLVQIEKGGTLILNSGTYWFDEISMSNTGAIVVPEGENVVIHTKKLYMTNTSFVGVSILSGNPDHTPEIYRRQALDVVNHDKWFEKGGNLRINVHQDERYQDNQINRYPYQVHLNSDAVLVGLVYNESGTYLTSDSRLFGALTTKDVYMDSQAHIVRSSGCFDLESNYELALTPSTQLALMCGSEAPQFSVKTSHNHQAQSADVLLSVSPNDADFVITPLAGFGSQIEQGKFRSNSSGVLKVTVKPNTYSAELANSTYQLTASIADDTSIMSRATFAFVPYKFDVKPHSEKEWTNQPIPIIAGKFEPIDVRVLACSADESNNAIVLKYNKTLDNSNLRARVTTPERNGVGDITVRDLTFEEGVAEANIMFSDAGSVNVTLEDPEFNCTNFSELVDPITGKCPINDGSLKGEFNLKSRPWKIAACHIAATSDGKPNPATQNSGSGFIAAGENFNVTYKPIVHSDAKGQASHLCDYPVTHNYFIDSAVDASFNVNFSVLYPNDGDVANLADTQSLAFAQGEAASGKVVEYAWDEVGSLNLQTTATYLGMPLDKDSVTIGRFYPKYFQVTGSDWVYPNGQSFAYMGQPFDGVTYSVEALNSNEGSLKNYALFESSNLAMFNIDELGTFAERFDAPNSEGSWGLSDETKSIGAFTIGGNSLCGVDSSNRTMGSACFIKDFTKINDPKGYADGPYNQGGDETKVGVVFAGNSQDPVAFLDLDTANDSRLVSQPGIRFGRVNLSDVGEKQGTDTVIHIPLRIEYWNGDRFTLNLDDSQTRVLGDKAKQVHIWPTGDGATLADVELSAGGNVVSGRSRSIEAREAESNRQQTRVWLNLDPSGNDLPWLKYNWDKDQAGEENPSSVVTFGIHRGNDRVIYRGEPGLTGH